MQYMKFTSPLSMHYRSLNHTDFLLQFTAHQLQNDAGNIRNQDLCPGSSKIIKQSNNASNLSSRFETTIAQNLRVVGSIF